jgi:hypothetical protein
VPAAIGNLTKLTNLFLHNNGCLTTTDTALAAFLTGFDSGWSNGCTE